MRHLTALAACLVLFAAHGVRAATIAATPATISTVWAQAKPGDVIALGANTYPASTFAGRAFSPPLTIDSTGATVTDWRFVKLVGLRWKGGTLRNRDTGAGAYGAALTFTGSAAPDGSPVWDCGDIEVSGAQVLGPFNATPGQVYVPGDGYGVSFSRCRGAAVLGSYLSGFKTGALFGMTAGARVNDNLFENMRSDGWNFGSVWGGEAQRNACHFFRITGAEHPDCGQAYSRPFYPNTRTPMPPSSDLVFRANAVMGQMQGIFLGNHVRDYPADAIKGWPALSAVDDGGFDRVTIEGHEIETGGGNAIGVDDIRVLTLRNNHVRTLPGAPYLANINGVAALSDVIRCGNTVADGGGKSGWSDAPCPDAVTTVTVQDPALVAQLVETAKALNDAKATSDALKAALTAATARIAGAQAALSAP